MNEESRKKIIIDTDPAMGTKGGDPEDCFAIMLAMNSPELEILGITTVKVVFLLKEALVMQAI